MFLFSLPAIALFAICLPGSAQTAKSVYKIPEAGIQLELPAGWDASKDANGTHVILKKDAGGYVVFSISVLPRDPSMTVDTLYSAFSEGVIENARKDWKGFKAGDIIKDTQNGMALRVQKLDGTVEEQGGELEGLVILMDAPKPLGIFAQRTKKHSDLLEKETTEILASLKKLQ
jgi:hypothetical protein